MVNLFSDTPDYDIAIDTDIKIDSTQLRALSKIKQKHKKHHKINLNRYNIKMTNMVNAMDVCCYFSYNNTLHQLITDTHYRNLFEVNKSGGSNNKPNRLKKDHIMFGYSKYMSHHLRPKYGNLHYHKKKIMSSASSYGELHLILKKSLHKYCTMTYGNSNTDSNVYYLEESYPFIKSLETTQYNNLAHKGVLEHLTQYVEIQIHCSLKLSKSFEAIRAPKKYKIGKEQQKLIEFSRKYDIPIQYY